MAALSRRRAEHSARQFDPALLQRLGVPLRRLALDSRKVRPGDIFLAYPGETQDGRRFISQAIAAGAGAVIWEAQGFDWNPAWRAPNLPVPHLREKAGVIAAQVYGDPSLKLRVIGVTGTNGKTSTSFWTAHALGALGRKTALVGTLGIGFPGALAPAPTTTPDPVTLQESMAGFLADGACCLAMEVSSHALDQGRVNGMRFACALFTNLSRDHLDYHGSMERYAAAKARLFRWPGLQRAVINLDDAFGRELLGELRGAGPELVGFGFSEEAGKAARGEGMAMVRGDALELAGSGLRFRVTSPWGDGPVASPMLGRFNAENLLATLAVLMACGIELPEARAGIAALPPVPGRLQQLGGGAQPLVVVDYAHTPDALEKALTALREVMAKVAGSRLILVFGCGGDRDRGKRPLMGEVASRLADFSFVTSDNPRSEDPRRIIAEVVDGMGPAHRVVEDRAGAIVEAIGSARAGDVVLIAGKGHEDYQEVRGERLPFNDVDVARLALAGAAGKGPQ